MHDRHRIEWWFYALALLPLLALGTVYLEASLASIVLGHWPIPSLNDPKDLPTAPLHFLAGALLLVALPAS
jgi:hypothetical protein